MKTFLSDIVTKWLLNNMFSKVPLLVECGEPFATDECLTEPSHLLVCWISISRDFGEENIKGWWYYDMWCFFNSCSERLRMIRYNDNMMMICCPSSGSLDWHSEGKTDVRVFCKKVKEAARLRQKIIQLCPKTASAEVRERQNSHKIMSYFQNNPKRERQQLRQKNIYVLPKRLADISSSDMKNYSALHIVRMESFCSSQCCTMLFQNRETLMK